MTATTMAAAAAERIVPARARLELRNASVAFGHGTLRHAAMENVSLAVAPGEFVSLIGPSGCGKSTALNVLAGFVRPTHGAALLDGGAITRPGPERAMVFQQYSLFPWLTVLRNVEFGLRAQGVGRAERRTRALALLGQAGLERFVDHYPDQLSGGMRQRVGIVRALATRPKVLLMDEPFGALDAHTRHNMQQLLVRMWEAERISVLFVTHDIEEAVFLSDRVLVMSAAPGRIVRAVPIDVARPRRADMVEEPAFRARVREIRGLLHGSGAVPAADPIAATMPPAFERLL
jgi:NitT/TauT family transport system ATP-binding protein